ncbi:MAG: hypothetical protein A2Y07_03825 [Planctomycetes bacterium GWF2_50_10]|nr:MAG: hypothetical protein A2Y07_03825 [Planctomycetes bacterium GWF2_50_10]
MLRYNTAMIEFLKTLINAKSTSDRGELAAANLIKDRLARAGIDSQIDVWEHSRANLTVHIASDRTRPALFFSSHLDVVPAGDTPWKYPAFEAAQHDGKIFGRGAADMKAGIVAAVEAICEIVSSSQSLKGDLIFSANAGEETDSCGIKRFIAASPPPPLAGIIVTEPTDLKVVNCHRGIFWIKITTRGKTAHGSMPHLGINAIESMRAILNALTDFRSCSFTHPVLGTSTTSINMISGGKAANVVPDECSLTVDIRTLPGQSHQTLLADIQRLLDSLANKNQNFSAEFSIARDCPALETQPDCDFVKLLCDIAKLPDPSPVQYTTDGPYLSKFGAPIVIFGPGSPQLCHQPDEYIEIDQLERAKEMYKHAILRTLA